MLTVIAVEIDGDKQFFFVSTSVILTHFFIPLSLRTTSILTSFISCLKNNLPFPLLSDTSTEMLQAFGAWGEKKMCGKTCIGTLRKTFVFDEQGVLTQVIEKVDTKNHAEQILG